MLKSTHPWDRRQTLEGRMWISRSCQSTKVANTKPKVGPRKLSMEGKEDAAKLNSDASCHGLNMKCYPWVPMFKHLVPIWCCCRGRNRLWMWSLLDVGHSWKIWGLISGPWGDIGQPCLRSIFLLPNPPKYAKPCYKFLLPKIGPQPLCLPGHDTQNLLKASAKWTSSPLNCLCQVTW